MEEKKGLRDKLKDIRKKRTEYKLVSKELKEARRKEKEEIAEIRKNNKDEIKALKKAKKFDEIYEKFGTDIYLENTKPRHRKKEINRLISEGRYTDLYEKFGYHIYKEYQYKIMAQDIYNETGSRPKSILNRVKNAIAHRILPVALSTLLIGPPVVGTTLSVVNEIDKHNNGIEHQAELEEYNKNINKYAEEIKGMNLTDVQIFMKLMDDMWKQIDGYKTPDEPDILGYLRLTLQKENVGVCRHFADDMTAKLNAINPEYNARNIAVFMEDNNYHIANIKRTVLEQNETVADESKEDKEQDNSILENETIKKAIGNHMVTAVDIPGQDLTLILDPTNPGIGVFVNGEIYMFSTSDGKGLDPAIIGQFFQGFGELTDLGLTSIKSYGNSNYSLEELEQIYGTNAQNEALAYLASMEAPIYAEESSFIPKATVNEKDAVQKTVADNSTKDMEELDKG